eukprot:6174001-Pyramimonas_sp.AAC.1
MLYASVSADITVPGGGMLLRAPARMLRATHRAPLRGLHGLLRQLARLVVLQASAVLLPPRPSPLLHFLRFRFLLLFPPHARAEGRFLRRFLRLRLRRVASAQRLLRPKLARTAIRENSPRTRPTIP